MQRLKSKQACFALLLILPILFSAAHAREVAGVMLDERIQNSNGDSLLLNGAGLREKLWVDVYVGSLYLPKKADDIAAIYANQGAYRIQLDFVYKKVSHDNLIEAWDEGFKKNQDAETLNALQSDLQQLYSIFDRDAVSGDQFIFDYLPGQGVSVLINGKPAGRIGGKTFKDALLDIWLGNEPADGDLKRGMIGLE